MSNQYAQDMIDFAVMQLGEPYVFGAIGPDRWDCRGLVRKAARYAGLDASILPAVNTVLELANWAKANGHFHGANETPEPGWIFIWGPADGSGPVKGAGHTGLVLEAVNPAHRFGWAISAYNPARGVCEHRLLPKAKSGHGLHGYVVLPYPANPEPPITEPEAPPPAEAIDGPDLQAQLDAANAKIAAAKAALG